jgi:hypothetical protein
MHDLKCLGFRKGVRLHTAVTAEPKMWPLLQNNYVGQWGFCYYLNSSLTLLIKNKKIKNKKYKMGLRKFYN